MVVVVVVVAVLATRASSSRDTVILVSIISSSPSRFSSSTRVSSNNSTQGLLTQEPFHFPNHRPTPLPPSSSRYRLSSLPIAPRVLRRHIRIPEGTRAPLIRGGRCGLP